MPTIKLKGRRGGPSFRANYSPEDVDHVEAHFDGARRVLAAPVGNSADAVITIAEDLYPETVVLLCVNTLV